MIDDVPAIQVLPDNGATLDAMGEDDQTALH
jgi:hypothetical protein